MGLESHNYYNLSGMRIGEDEWRALSSDPRNVVLRHSHVLNVCIVSRWTGIDVRHLYPQLNAAHPMIFDCGVVVRGRVRVIVRTDNPMAALDAHAAFLRKFTWWRVLVLIVSLAIASFLTGMALRYFGVAEWEVFGMQVFGITDLGMRALPRMLWWAPVGDEH